MLRSPLLHFLLAGVLLFALQSAWSSVPQTPIVEVRRGEIDERIESYRLQMGRAASPSEAQAIEEQVIENAIWLEQAFALGLHEIDSVVRQRLILNMRFLEGSVAAGGPIDPGKPGADTSTTSDQALFERALELGMDRSDTVVQRRLVDRVQAIVRAAVRARPVDDATLEAHFEATQERWREPSMLDLSHVYLSRDKRADATLAAAAALLAQLREGATEPDAAIAMGDPFLAGHRLRGATPNRIVARLGPTFAAGVEDAPTQRWIGPVESAFGQHLVWIHERIESRIPELEAVRPRVLEDWIEIESRKALREQVEHRRKVVEVRVVDDRATPSG
ncbi:MAG: hypothetical protein CL908_25040 [Deltaproteobacteria bacterium]|nr:hypothetical protein [Deltaproteobacteria bacterium]